MQSYTQERGIKINEVKFYNSVIFLKVLLITDIQLTFLIFSLQLQPLPQQAGQMKTDYIVFLQNLLGITSISSHRGRRTP